MDANDNATPQASDKPAARPDPELDKIRKQLKGLPGAVRFCSDLDSVKENVALLAEMLEQTLAIMSGRGQSG